MSTGELTVVKEMLQGMDIPQARLSLTKADLHWLSRNLGVRNHRHPKFGDAIGRIQKLLAEK